MSHICMADTGTTQNKEDCQSHRTPQHPLLIALSGPFIPLDNGSHAFHVSLGLSRLIM